MNYLCYYSVLWLTDVFASVLTLQLSIKKFSKGLTSFVFLSVSGLALCQVIFVYSLSNNSEGDVVFLENYYKLAQPLQSLYYMLFAICTVSVFDRFALFLILTSICAMINKYIPCCHIVFWDLLLNRCMTTWNLCFIWLKRKMLLKVMSSLQLSSNRSLVRAM